MLGNILYTTVEPLILTVVSLVLFIFVWLKAREDPAGRIFFRILISIGLWGVILFAMRSSTVTDAALLWERAVIIPTFAVSLFFYHFSLVYTHNRSQNAVLVAAYGMLVIITVLSLTDKIVSGMDIRSYGYAPVITPLGVVFFATGFLLMETGNFNLIKRYRATTSNQERSAIFYLIVASILYILGMGVDAFADLPPVGVWGNLLFCLISAVAILKYHLLDVRLIIRGALAYAVVSIVVSIPYFSVWLLLTRGFNLSTLPLWLHFVIIVATAVVLSPLYSAAQELVDRIFYRRHYDAIQALDEFGRESQKETNIDNLSDAVTKLMSRVVGSVRAPVSFFPQKPKTRWCLYRVAVFPNVERTFYLKISLSL